jgi:protein transport protein SEC61 subunit gamma-like protein
MEEVNKPQTNIDEKHTEAIKKPGLGSKIKEKLKQYKRVLTVARKPDKEEFILSAKITSGGIVFLGLIGFIIFLIYYLILSIPGV